MTRKEIEMWAKSQSEGEEGFKQILNVLDDFVTHIEQMLAAGQKKHGLVVRKEKLEQTLNEKQRILWKPQWLKHDTLQHYLSTVENYTPPTFTTKSKV